MSFVMRNFVKAAAAAAMVIVLVSPAAAQELKVGVVSVPILMDRGAAGKGCHGGTGAGISAAAA